MRKGTRPWLILLTLFLLMVFFSLPGLAAEKYPAKPIKIIVPYGPGGGSDVSIRVFAKYAQEFLNQPIVVTNIVGGGGVVGAMEALKARPDGYTLFWHHEAIHVAHITGTADFGWEAFYPVCQAGYATDVVAVKTESPWNTIEDFMGYIKSNPGKVRMAVTIGATTHFTAVEMDVATGGGNKIVLVAGKGDSDRATKLLGGFIESSIFSMPGAASFIEAGKFRGLATTGKERSKFMPSLPTLVEKNYDVVSEKNYVVFAPPGIPEDVAGAISSAFEKMTADKRVEKDLAAQTVVPMFLPHAEIAKKLAEIEARYRRVAKVAGLIKK